MSTFIANAIIKAAKKSEEKGKEKYGAYFVKTHIYEEWRKEVDSILETEGYKECIVVE